VHVCQYFFLKIFYGLNSIKFEMSKIRPNSEHTEVRRFTLNIMFVVSLTTLSAHSLEGVDGSKLEIMCKQEFVVYFKETTPHFPWRESTEYLRLFCMGAGIATGRLSQAS
jgi:hypothetical protein